ncbi:MFS transporter [soil metagenome]
MDNVSAKKIAHIIVGGTVGNITEWYNFLLYGYLAAVISQLFFPAKNALLSLTLTFSVFALSFFARPIGGVLFGWIGDTYGRQRALIFSLILMGIPTVLIGCFPSYESVGVISPILLCVLRICQGFAAGGEHTGSAIYVAEHAPAARKTLWVSTVPASAAVGVLISSATAWLIIHSFSSDQLLSWGWRVGFWAGGLLCFISLLLRISMPESPLFEKVQKENVAQHHSLLNLMKNREVCKSLLIVFCLASTWGIFYQILFIWMPTYLTRIAHLDNSTALKINSLYILILAILIIAVGYFADYLKRKLLLTIACVGMMIVAYPLFSMLSSGITWKIYSAMALFTLIFSLYLPVAFVSMIEAFPVNIRFTSLSFSFNIGLALFGGTTPLIATWLIEITGNKLAPAYYLIAAAMLGLGAVACLLETKKNNQEAAISVIA